MPKFEKQYVHFMWDDELEGKKGFFADDIVTLCTDVSHNNRNWYGSAYSGAEAPYQFNCDDKYSFHFFYHDPHYDLKVAHEQGKKIECKGKGEAWEDLDYTPATALPEDLKYHIKPEEEKPVTHRELARWLAQGNGEWRWYNVGDVTPYAQIDFRYSVKEGFHPVKKLALVRKWNDDEWHEPSRGYMGLE